MLPMYFTEGSFSKSNDAELTGLLRIMRNMCQVFDDSFLTTAQYGCGRRRQGRAAARWRAILMMLTRWPSRQTGS
jgi:hypothetical protein